MYSLIQNHTFVHLNEDLSLLEYGNAAVRFAAPAPFQVLWQDRPLTAENMLRKSVTANPEEIRIEFADFRFSARFPGNSYCRPDRKYTPDFRFTAVLRLQDGELCIRVENVRVPAPNALKIIVAQNFFAFPTAESAALVMPVDYGTQLNFPRSESWQRTLHPSAEWSLPAHGLFRPQGGIGFWCDEPDREYELSVNMDAAGTARLECRHFFDAVNDTAREMRFMLFPAGSDFRALARRTRALRQASGRFRTLAEKMAANPEVAQLPGTVFWKHNVYYRSRPQDVQPGYSLYVARPDWNENEGLPNNWTAAEVFETARAAGFDRVNICNTGWNRDGFDAGYPARLPINPERGTEAELRAAVADARQLSPGYTLSVHDNYIDAYESSEEFRSAEMLQEIPGVPREGSIWRGGPTHRLCSVSGLQYARRDLPRVAELFGRGCIYLDVCAGIPLYCCRADAHPVTRTQDLANRRELFALAKRCFGGLAVEGCGTDHFADLIDIGAYGGLHCGWLPPRLPDQPVPVPLWQMIYHDSVLNYFGEGYTGVHGAEYRLYQALYVLLPTGFDAHSLRLSRELRSAYTAPMVDFVELTPRRVCRQSDGSFRTFGAAMSTFGDGTRVIANFDDTELEFDGMRIPAREYRIEPAASQGKI